MKEPECLENYPVTTVIVSNLVPLVTWITGAFILSRISLPWALLYLLFVFALEFRLVSGHCRDCYYFGKTCAFGKGRLSALLFRRGNPEAFTRLKIGWKDLVPDFLVFLVPVIAGIVLLVQQFSWTIHLLIIVLLLLGFAGNAFVRGHLACRFCKQREIGCPAERLFDAKKTSWGSQTATTEEPGPVSGTLTVIRECHRDRSSSDPRSGCISESFSSAAPTGIYQNPDVILHELPPGSPCCFYCCNRSFPLSRLGR